MSEENNQKVIIVQQRKTAAPIILAIIAFVLWIPSLLCNAVCAAVVSEANKGSGGGWVMLPSIMSFVCFVLCFMCKTKNSAKTGGIIIALAVLIMIFNVVLFNLLALISAILYIVAGAYSISNAKRPA